MQNNKFGQIGHARLSLLLIMLIAFSQVFLPASGADPIAAPATPSAKSPGLTGNIDLASTQALMQNKASAPLQVSVGGTLSNSKIVGGSPVTFQPGQSLTPAQFMAVQQVLHTGTQTLLLSSQGSAAG